MTTVQSQQIQQLYEHIKNAIGIIDFDPVAQWTSS